MVYNGQVVAIVVSVMTSAALDKHEKIGKFGFTSLGITEVSTCLCVAFIGVVCTLMLYFVVY